MMTRILDAIEKFRATRNTLPARDLALLAARIGLGWIFIYHGSHTLFGAFGAGGGIHPQEVYFRTVAHLPVPEFFAVLGGIIECFGGIAVALGIFGRLAAAGLVGDMVIAMITVTFKNGIVSNAAGSGYELNVALAALALVVAILGTGRLSLDQLVRPYALKAVHRPGSDRTPPGESPLPAPVRQSEVAMAASQTQNEPASSD